MLMPSHAKVVQPYRDRASDLLRAPASKPSSTACCSRR
jgi:hypothetical protein